MAGKNFAHESDKFSVALSLIGGMGDCLISKKILEAVIELAPRCLFDIYYYSDHHKDYAQAFFGQIKNLNCMFDYKTFHDANVKKYDLALYLSGTRVTVIEAVNQKKISETLPELFKSLIALSQFKKRNFHDVGSSELASLRNSTLARILGKNCYWFLSGGGALPVHDDKVSVPLLPKFKAEFDKLKLDKYITIYSDIERDTDKPKAKAWPLRNIVEYVALMKKRLPNVEIVQCGASVDTEIENADRKFLDCDLELTKYILANSLLHVGSEGGLIHLATAVGTRCIVLFGPTSAPYFGYNRNINIVPDICYPCSDVVGDSNIRVCMRGNKEPLCMLSHTPQFVCELTCNYLRNKI